MTQRFATTSVNTKTVDAFVPREKTIEDVEKIITGKCDSFTVEQLQYIGSLDELSK